MPAMSDRTLKIECQKCHALNFVALTASSREFVCVSCGAPLDLTEKRAYSDPPPAKGTDGTDASP